MVGPSEAFSAFGHGQTWGLDPSSTYHRIATDADGVVRIREENGELVATGITSASPASAASVPTGVAIAWRAADNTLSYKLLENGQWRTEQKCGGKLIGSPVPIHFGNALRIFGLGPDGMIRMWTSAGWSDSPGFRLAPLLRFAEVPHVFVRNALLVIWATGEDGRSTWESTSKDGASFTAWKLVSAQPRLEFSAQVNGKGPCTIHNHSASSDAHVLHLLANADAAMGVEDESEGRGAKAIGLSDASDRFFVGRHYVGWIDQTGFQGELNGLWVLNGRRGVELDFVVAPHGEPLNSFIPGELNDGTWGPGYSGAEHIEVPVPDQGQWGLDEAGYMFGGASDIGWWRACNGKGVTWNDVFLPYEDQHDDQANSRVMTWEDRLAKVADYIPGWSGETCGDDYYQDDATTIPIKLRVGLELFGDEPRWNRTYQYVNPTGNPIFSTVINIVTATAWGYTPPRRQEHAYTFVRNGSDPWEEMSTTIEPDIIVCGEVSISTSDREVYGSSFRASGGNTCYCDCFAHGGIELGGDGGVGKVALRGGTNSDRGVESFELLGTPPDSNGKKYSIAKYDTLLALGTTRSPVSRSSVRQVNRSMVFEFQEHDAPMRLVVSNAAGAVVQTMRIDPGTTRFVWDASGVPRGLYGFSIRRVVGSGPGEVGLLSIL